MNKKIIATLLSDMKTGVDTVIITKADRKNESHICTTWSSGNFRELFSKYNVSHVGDTDYFETIVPLEQWLDARNWEWS